MQVLMITGDRSTLTPGTPSYERVELQRKEVKKLDVVYWGKGSLSLISAEGYNLVTAQDPFWRGFVAWRAARRAHAKLQLQIHTDLAAQSFLKRTLAKFLLRRADCIRVVSEHIQQSLLLLHVRAPVSVLPVFIDEEAIRTATPAELKKQFPQFKKILLVASRLEWEKNVGVALYALKEMLVSVPDTGLLIAGEGSERHPLQQLARNLGLEKSVIFLGNRKDVFSLYKGADCVLNPSRFEGYGASVVEALSTGCPVVSTDVGVAREAGAVVVPRKEFAETVARVLRSDSRGQLKLQLLSRDEWAKQWKETLCT